MGENFGNLTRDRIRLVIYWQMVISYCIHCIQLAKIGQEYFGESKVICQICQNFLSPKIYIIRYFIKLTCQCAIKSHFVLLLQIQGTGLMHVFKQLMINCARQIIQCTVARCQSFITGLPAWRIGKRSGLPYCYTVMLHTSLIICFVPGYHTQVTYLTSSIGSLQQTQLQKSD